MNTERQDTNTARNIRNNVRCESCARVLDTGESIYHIRGGKLYYNEQSGSAGLCHQCACQRKGSLDTYTIVTLCDHCHREIICSEYFVPIRIYCTQVCRSSAGSIRVKNRKAVERIRDCQKCGSKFQPPRNDARFCSARCKQSEHRRQIAEKLNGVSRGSKL
jgi:hypothetical protein